MGVFDKNLDKYLEDKLLSYARDVAASGVRARFRGERVRHSAKPHASAAEHLDEVIGSLWGDAAEGRVLLCSSVVKPLLGAVSSVPMARVPKMNPDRTPSQDGRLIWDGRVPNAYCWKEDHPPADQPRHRDLMREILWWQLRFPTVAILLSKKDIAAAFRLLVTNLQDCGVFGADFDGAPWGITGLLITVYLVLTFGWTGAPGEWMIWAWIIKLLHASWGPADPRWDDLPAFHSQFLMDDQILVEPDVGTRSWQSVAVADMVTAEVLGPESRNLVKDQEEGVLETRKIVWGLSYDTVACTCSLPEPKLEKAQFFASGLAARLR